MYGSREKTSFRATARVWIPGAGRCCAAGSIFIVILYGLFTSVPPFLNCLFYLLYLPGLVSLTSMHSIASPGKSGCLSFSSKARRYSSGTGGREGIGGQGDEATEVREVTETFLKRRDGGKETVEVY
jgi:hypothetical protein